MKRTRLAAAFLVVLFGVSGSLLVGHLQESHNARTLQLAAAEAAHAAPTEEPAAPAVSVEPAAPSVSPEPAPAEEPAPREPQLEEGLQFLLETDLDALRETNGDVLGWICIPGSNISYPLMRSADNREYLELAWDGSPSKAGSIFLERKNQPDFSDFHTLIYGHNWGNGVMFSALLEYGKQEYADSHPYVYIVTDESIRQYRVFSAYTADVVSDTYRLYFEDDARRQTVLDFYASQSQVETDLAPTAADRILTLSTCTGRGIAGIRWVVHTVLAAEFPRG